MRVQIDHAKGMARALEAGVVPGNPGVFDDDVVVAGPPESDDIRGEFRFELIALTELEDQH